MDDMELANALAKLFIKEEFSLELLGKSHNTVYRVLCSNPFALRITAASHRSRGELAGELSFLSYLFERGAGVAPPIPSLSGETVVAKEANGQIVYTTAFSLAEGNAFWERPNDKNYSGQIGRELGKIHRLSKNYKPEEAEWKRRFFLEGQHLCNATEIFENYKYDLKEAYLKFLRRLSMLPKTDLNFGLTHGDFLFSNYNITSEGKVTVFDFDECEYSWFISDIAVYLYYYLIGGHPLKDISQTEEAQQFAYDFMRGYLSENNLPLEELDHLYLFFALRDYILLSTILERGEQGQWDHDLKISAMGRLLQNKPFFDGSRLKKRLQEA